MSSPVRPSQFCDLTPTASTEPCTAVKNLFFTLPRLLCSFFTWFLNADGTITSDAIRSLFPPGMIIGFAGEDAPSGFLLCDGQALSRTDYADLFLAIGTTWGAGDGVTTFNIPNGKRRALLGSDSAAAAFALGMTGGEETHLLTSAESGLVAHIHAVGVEDSPVNIDTALGEIKGEGADTQWSPNAVRTQVGYTRSVAAADAASSHNNMPPYFTGNWIIKV